MKLRLTDGRIIPAEKDCGCLEAVHAGPHWLYMDDYLRATSNRLLAAGNVRGFIVAEITRLKEKEYQMSIRGVVEII